MEKMNIFFLIVIAAYLLYSYMKERKKQKGDDLYEKKATQPAQESVFSEEVHKNALVVVAAAVAAVMGEQPYRITRIFLKGKVDEKKSHWKIAGRHENMNRRFF